MGGKDTGHGDAGHADAGHGHAGADLGLGWVPFTSLRFWVFLFTFGGGAGLALGWLGSSAVVGAVGALAIGWASGAFAVAAIRSLSRQSVSSDLRAADLVGATGTLVLP